MVTVDSEDQLMQTRATIYSSTSVLLLRYDYITSTVLLLGYSSTPLLHDYYSGTTVPVLLYYITTDWVVASATALQI